MEITSRDLKVNTFVDLRTIEEKKLKENVRYYLSTVNHFRKRSPLGNKFEKKNNCKPDY